MKITGQKGFRSLGFGVYGISGDVTTPKKGKSNGEVQDDMETTI